VEGLACTADTDEAAAELGWSDADPGCSFQQTWEHAHPVMENLFLHNDHWKDKHMVTVWQCGMVMKGWQNL
jgi:hypothetical protein